LLNEEKTTWLIAASKGFLKEGFVRLRLGRKKLDATIKEELKKQTLQRHRFNLLPKAGEGRNSDHQNKEKTSTF